MIFYQLIQFTFEVLNTAHPGSVFTFGGGSPGPNAWAAFDRLVLKHGVRLDYMSYHLFPSRQGEFLQEALSMAAEARKRGIDVVCSEFEGVNWNPGQLPVYARDLSRVYAQFGNIGGQVWGFLQSNVVIAPSPRHPYAPYWDGVLAPVDPGNYDDPIFFNVFDDVGLVFIQRWNQFV